MITKHIPNTITSMNLLCGTLGVIMAFSNRLDLAFCLMLAAAVFDFCDGLSARLLDAYSDMGKELDSLSDLVSFGVLPAVMLYNVSKACMFGSSWICWTPVLIAVFSGLRLAKFNVDPRQTSGFIGLATPANAMICGSLCYYVAFNPASFLATWFAGPVFLPVLTACSCFLLVSEIPMFSMKFHKDDSAALRTKRLAFAIIVAASVLVCAVFKLNWSLAVLLSFTLYVVKNIVYWIFRI